MIRTLIRFGITLSFLAAITSGSVLGETATAEGWRLLSEGHG
jgi:hypothetical protein